MPLILRDPRDPPVAEDGRCVVCHCERKPGANREPHRTVALADPFCSSECSRAWYGVTLPSTRYSTSGNPSGHHGQVTVRA